MRYVIAAIIAVGIGIGGACIIPPSTPKHDWQIREYGPHAKIVKLHETCWPGALYAEWEEYPDPDNYAYLPHEGFIRELPERVKYPAGEKIEKLSAANLSRGAFFVPAIVCFCLLGFLIQSWGQLKEIRQARRKRPRKVEAIENPFRV